MEQTCLVLLQVAQKYQAQQAPLILPDRAPGKVEQRTKNGNSFHSEAQSSVFWCSLTRPDSPASIWHE